MPNLFDTIQQNRTGMVSGPAPVTDQTNQVQTLLRAKSGRAVGGGDEAASGIGEAAANDQTNQQLRGLGQQVQAQGQAEKVQAQGQEQQFQQQKQQIDQARKFDTLQNKIQVQQVLNDLSQKKGQLSMEQQQSKLEQASFLMSMQDKQYTDTLQQVGNTRRLNNEANFRNEMQEQAFGDNIALLRQKLGTQDVLATNDRDFQKMLSGMSIQDAQAMASIEAKNARSSSDIEAGAATTAAQNKAAAANLQNQFKAAGTLVNAGTQAYGAYAGGKFDSAPETPTNSSQSGINGSGGGRIPGKV